MEALAATDRGRYPLKIILRYVGIVPIDGVLVTIIIIKKPHSGYPNSPRLPQDVAVTPKRSQMPSAGIICSFADEIQPRNFFLPALIRWATVCGTSWSAKVTETSWFFRLMEVEGLIFLHLGDKSAFRARRAP